MEERTKGCTFVLKHAALDHSDDVFDTAHWIAVRE
jgi:hypothetical protein